MNFKKLESIEVFVNEHLTEFTPTEVIEDCSASVCYRAECDGKLYGEYVSISKPALSVEDVVGLTNIILRRVVDFVNRGGKE